MTTASVPAEQHAPRPPSGDGDTEGRDERDEGGGPGPVTADPAPDAPPWTGTTGPARPPGGNTAEPAREAGAPGGSGGTDVAAGPRTSGTTDTAADAAADAAGPAADGVAHADSAAPPASPAGPVASRAPADRTADTDRTVRSHRPDRAETANGTGRPDASPRAGRADRIGRAEARTAPPPPPRSPARAPGRDPANGHHPDRPGDADAAGNAAQADARRAGTTGSAPTAGGPAPAAPGHPPESTPGASCPACRRPLTDPLTGALDRFSWEAAAAPLIAAARRDGAPVALVLADLDGFKGVNDRYGHPAGDAVLSTTGSVLRALAAEVDGALVGRYGSWAGDEFLILLPGARVADALALAHRAAREVRAARVEAPAGRQATVTLTGQRVSLGVAGVRHVPDPGPGAGGHATDVLRALVLDADAALRAAKRAGGGRVHVQADPAEDPAGAAPEPYAPPGGGTGGTAGTGPLDSVRIALPPDEVRLHGAGPAELVLTPAAAEHLHAVLSELLTRPHSREDR